MVTSLKISEELKEELNNYRYEKEAYHVVIKRILEENKQLKEDVEYLKKDKEQLYKLVLKTEDSIAFPNNVHRAFYVIIKVIEDNYLTSEEQLARLEHYLAKLIEEDLASVIDAVDNIKEMLVLENLPENEVLVEFEKWLNEDH